MGERDDACAVGWERAGMLVALQGRKGLCYWRNVVLGGCWVGEGIYFECSSSGVVPLPAVISIISTIIVEVLCDSASNSTYLILCNAVALFLRDSWRSIQTVSSNRFFLLFSLNAETQNILIAASIILNSLKIERKYIYLHS